MVPEILQREATAKLRFCGCFPGEAGLSNQRPFVFAFREARTLAVPPDSLEERCPFGRGQRVQGGRSIFAI